MEAVANGCSGLTGIDLFGTRVSDAALQTLARGVSVKRHLAKYRAAAIIVQSRARRLGEK